MSKERRAADLFFTMRDTVIVLGGGEMDMATIDEMENRMRELASEVEGEKAVTRHIFEQGRRNASDLAAIRSEVTIMRAESGDRLDRLAGDMMLANSALRSHGARLDSLTRDVGSYARMLRNCVAVRKK
jgi:hypothetical protein